MLIQVLASWKSSRHRVLLFSQKKRMLGLFEAYFHSKKWSFLRMDGTTPPAQRGVLVEQVPAAHSIAALPSVASHVAVQFNSDKSIFAFMLTTKTGGVGLNLTGADRVVIYDPDWNPSTDMQARERSWRIGQDKDVAVYRFLSAGTIEEKMYHRQLFKQFVSNKVLSDPNSRKFFNSKSLADLFLLGDEDSCSTLEMFDAVDAGDEETTAATDDGEARVMRHVLNGSVGVFDHEKIVSHGCEHSSIIAKARAIAEKVCFMTSVAADP
jgi:DNA excision repair protein ERCC-6